MEHQPKIREYDKVKYSDKDMWWAITKTAFACFVVLAIYFRFIVVEDNQKAIQTSQETDKAELLKEITNIHAMYSEDKVDIYDAINSKDAAQRLRLDTKTNRIEKDNIRLWTEVNRLKLPNTDKNK